MRVALTLATVVAVVIGVLFVLDYLDLVYRPDRTPGTWRTPGERFYYWRKRRKGER